MNFYLYLMPAVYRLGLLAKHCTYYNNNKNSEIL